MGIKHWNIDTIHDNAASCILRVECPTNPQRDHAMSPSYFIFILTLLFAFYTGCFGEGCTQTRDGCKIDDGRCICGNGCYIDYRYTTRAECQNVLRGSRANVCRSNPCRNKGTCLPVSFDPGFKCRCEGTGYYGPRCQKACPKLTARTPDEYPFECIVV